MTSMTSFILIAGLLVLAVLGFLLPPLLRAPKSSSAANRREANLNIFRDQLSELERDRLEGTLAEADFEQSKNELQRRLLGEVQPEETKAPARSGRKTATALLIALPLVAIAGYSMLGSPQALDPANAQSSVSRQQIDSMLEKLVNKLKENPNDAKGWVLLARSYKMLGRFPEAADAYSHGTALVETDSALLADYAEVLVQINGGRFGGKADELIQRALKIDANEPQALFLAGAAASDRKDFSAVANYWSRLLKQLEPGSEEAQSLEAAVEKAREIVAQSGGKPATKVLTNAEAISGEVTLSGKIAAQAKPDDLLFIFARSDEGSRMPLAVIRTQVAQLPLKFRLDDALALPGGQKISSFKTVTIEARVAKAGKAQSSSGDLFVTIKNVKVGTKNVKLVIDQVQP
ncbi:MAG: c-type cytochrome biogenesis protein CcmI [Betaproteobacteria bacterium]